MFASINQLSTLVQSPTVLNCANVCFIAYDAVFAVVNIRLIVYLYENGQTCWEVC